MSGVDVVAVLERCRDELKARGQACVAEQAAIATVAELMEAGQTLLDGEPGDEEWERFEAALANATGGGK